MLSLLSLIIASGTVLRADTEQWEPRNYPDPRVNYTQCNVLEGSTLCDPDHMLTDTWRQTIQDSITKQVERFKESVIPYKAGASEECRSNTTEPPQIYIILAKRIHTASNQSTTSNDLELFGEGLSQAFELDNQSCKNYILLLGVEGKTIKVWTGDDLEVTREQVYKTLNKHLKLFTEKGYMEGLNKCVEELGDTIVDPYKDDVSVTGETHHEEATDSMDTTKMPTTTNSFIPVWMYIVTILCIIITICVLFLLAFLIRKHRRMSNTTHVSHEKPATRIFKNDAEHGQDNGMTFGDRSNRDDNLNKTLSSPSISYNIIKKPFEEDDKSFTSEISLPRSASMNTRERSTYSSMPGIDISRVSSRIFPLNSLASQGTNDEEPLNNLESSASTTSSTSQTQESQTEYEIANKMPITSATLSTDTVISKVRNDNDVDKNAVTVSGSLFF